MIENTYKKSVALARLRSDPDYRRKPIWAVHQKRQMDFLVSRGFTPDSNVLDLGCGPLRLGVKLIPELSTGWYFGQDINPKTLAFGREVLADVGITSGRYTLFCSDGFSLQRVDREIDIAFSNSLFSHLTLNSILMCLRQVRPKLAPKGVYYSTYFKTEAGKDWLEPQPRHDDGRDFNSYPDRDPYHYPNEVMQSLATNAGFDFSEVSDYGHPTQTMACFTAGP